MPFFISKEKLQVARANAYNEGYESGLTDGEKAVKRARESGNYLTGFEIRFLTKLVPGLEKYTYKGFLGDLQFNKRKLNADLADLDAHEAAERGRKIALTLAGDTADYAKALKEEGK